MLTTAEAARYLGVDPRTLLRWVKQGLLPRHRKGPKLCCYMKEDLDRMVRPESRKVSSLVQ